MYIAMNKVAVPAAHRQAVIEAFERSAPEMKRFRGFLGLELWTDEDDTLYAISRWESREAMEEYTSNSLFKDHHGGSGNPQTARPDLVTHYNGKVVI